MEEFYRIRRLPPYVFEEVNRVKAKARNAGADIIDLGMGNPDLPAPAAHHRQAEGDARQAAHRPLFGLARHPGPAPRPGRLLRAPLRREAQSRHAGRRHARLQGRLRQHGAGDHRAGRRRPGARPDLSDPRLRLPDGGRRHPLGAVRADAGLLRARSSAPSRIRSRSRSRWSSAIRRTRPRYVADLDFYKDLVAFAKKHDIFILSDLAYAEIYFDDNPPPSVLQVPGAMDIAVEFTSMSKTYSMPGWRMGFAVGNERLIAALGAREVLSRLRRLHADPGRGRRGAQRPGRLHQGDARDLHAPPRRAGRELRAAPAGTCRRRAASMFAWAPIPEPFRDTRPRRILQAAGREGRRRGLARHRLRRAWRGLSCASRWSRTSSASARPRATSGASSRPAPEQLHNVVPLATAALDVLITSACVIASESGCRRSRHGRRRSAAAQIVRERELARSAAAGRSRSSRSAPRSRGKDRGIDLTKHDVVRRSGRAGATIPDIDVFVELIGGDGDPAKAAVEAALSRRQARGHRQQGAARPARRRARDARREARRRAQFRGRGGRRHPDRQDAARGARRQCHRRASTASSTAPAITS